MTDDDVPQTDLSTSKVEAACGSVFTEASLPVTVERQMGLYRWLVFFHICGAVLVRLRKVARTATVINVLFFVVIWLMVFKPGL